MVTRWVLALLAEVDPLLFFVFLILPFSGKDMEMEKGGFGLSRDME